MEEKNQPIFTKAYSELLREQLRKGITISDYLKANVEYPAESILQSTLTVSRDIPELDYSVDKDIDNAIKVFEYLTNLDKTQASDKRLWTYLSHVTFRDYTMNRWKIGYSEQELSDMTNRRKAVNSVDEHWFVSGGDRSMRRHALARLWWAAYLTIAPWRSDPGYFKELEQEDQYIYTRTLLSSQDIYLQILERGMGRSSRLLIAILEFLRQNPGVAHDREKLRNLIKELNLVLSYRKLAMLDLNQLLEVMAGISTVETDNI